MFKFCTECGEKNSIGARFCQSCGALLDTAENSKQSGETHEEEESREEGREQKTTYSERKQEFVGKIMKCPNCGEILKSFMAKCPSCGHEIRNIKTSGAVREFSLRLEQIEAQRLPYEKEQKSVMKMIFGRDLKKDEDSEDTVEKRFEEQKNKEKANLICNFSVPNTKEDILEFLLLTSSNINTKHGVDDIVSKAWIAKLDQIYQKAEILFRDDLELEEIKNLYEEKRKEIKIAKLKMPLLVVALMAFYIIIMGFLWNAAVTLLILVLILSAIGVLWYKRKKANRI